MRLRPGSRRAPALLLALALAGCQAIPSTSEAGAPRAIPAERTVLAASMARPISDFVDQQGTYCIDDGAGGCFLFVPPIQNFIGFDNIPDDANPPPSSEIRHISFDYAGLADAWITEASRGQVSLGTTFGGHVTERPLSDGTTEVHVVLNVKNALTFVAANTPDPSDNEFATGPLLFGYRAPDVVAGATPALGDATLRVTFTNTAPGAPLPDLLQLLFEPEPGQSLRSISITATAEGPLRSGFGVDDGTSGHMKLSQVGLLHTSFMGANADAFPVENIELRVIGR